MDLQKRFVDLCPFCQQTGWLGDNVCSCMLKVRAYGKLLNSGFKPSVLDIISENYELPTIILGENFVDFYMKNLYTVEDKGLSLFIWSSEKGRGKTTLAHYLTYCAAYNFSFTSRYSTRRDYKFIHANNFNTADPKELSKVKWLVIDDLGNEDKSAPWKSSKLRSDLMEIFQYRRDNFCPTIITSNYSPTDLSNLYAQELDSLLEINVDGSLQGVLFREVVLGGAEDLRKTLDSGWPTS